MNPNQISLKTFVSLLQSKIKSSPSLSKVKYFRQYLEIHCGHQVSFKLTDFFFIISLYRYIKIKYCCQYPVMHFNYLCNTCHQISFKSVYFFIRHQQQNLFFIPYPGQHPVLRSCSRLPPEFRPTSSSRTCWPTTESFTLSMLSFDFAI